jgi:hypothetical protein
MLYRITRRAKLLKDGERLIAAIKAGRSPRDLLLTFSGSRATFYRAIKAASVNGALPRANYGRTRRVAPISADDDSQPELRDPLLE